MVIAEAKRRHGQKRHVIARVRFQWMTLTDHHRAFLDSAHTQDPYLRLDNDRRLEPTSRCAVVAQRKGPALQIIQRRADSYGPFLQFR